MYLGIQRRYINIELALAWSRARANCEYSVCVYQTISLGAQHQPLSTTECCLKDSFGSIGACYVQHRLDRKGSGSQLSLRNLALRPRREKVGLSDSGCLACRCLFLLPIEDWSQVAVGCCWSSIGSLDSARLTRVRPSYMNSK